MGSHKAGFVAVGAFVESKLRDYIDRFAQEHGLLTRSDAIRTILHEHQAVFSNRIRGKVALTPLEVSGNDTPKEFNCKTTKSK